MHYSRHRLTALVVYVTTLTYASTNAPWARPACPLVSSSKPKPCQLSSVTSLCVRLYRPVVVAARLAVNTAVVRLTPVQFCCLAARAQSACEDLQNALMFLVMKHGKNSVRYCEIPYNHFIIIHTSGFT